MISLITRRSRYLLAFGAGLFLFAAAGVAQEEEGWMEVRSPHFVVVGNAGARDLRRTAYEFERAHALYYHALSDARLDPKRPVVIIVPKNRETARTFMPETSESQRRGAATFSVRFHPEKYNIVIAPRFWDQWRTKLPFRIVATMLVELNYRPLPIWVESGLASALGNAEIRFDDIALGTPDAGYLYWLSRYSLLPMDRFLNTEWDSPLFEDPSKAVVFHAQSWAFAHYLLFAGNVGTRRRIDEILSLIRDGVPSAQAVEQVLGDLSKLQKTLESYLRRQAIRVIPVAGPPPIDQDTIPVRNLSHSEVNAMIADFLLQAGNPAEARRWLEKNIKEHNVPARTLELLARSEQLEGRREDALRHVEQAIEQDSESFFAHYVKGLLLAESGSSTDQSARAEEELIAAVQLNRDFAPAYNAVAELYLKLGLSQTALARANYAVQLDPVNVAYRVTQSRILQKLNAHSEAIGAASLAMQCARTKEDQSRARALLQELQNSSASDIQADMPHNVAGRTAAQKMEEPQRPGLRRRSAVPRPERTTAEGTVSLVTCQAFSMDLELVEGEKSVRLHTDNLLEIEFFRINRAEAVHVRPCKELRGKKVRVTFRPIENKLRNGELVSVELLQE